MINFTLSLSLLGKQFDGFNNYSSAFKLIALNMNHRFIQQKYDIKHMAFINKYVGFYMMHEIIMEDWTNNEQQIDVEWMKQKLIINMSKYAKHINNKTTRRHGNMLVHDKIEFNKFDNDKWIDEYENALKTDKSTTGDISPLYKWSIYYLFQMDSINNKQQDKLTKLDEFHVFCLKNNWQYKISALVRNNDYSKVISMIQEFVID